MYKSLLFYEERLLDEFHQHLSGIHLAQEHFKLNFEPLIFF